MPFVEVNIEQEIEKRRKNDADFREAWDNSREEYRLIGELVSLRKKNNITQKELAKLSNNKQQMISRIEKKESNPTLRTFCNLLSSLGYELKIVKKRPHNA